MTVAPETVDHALQARMIERFARPLRVVVSRKWGWMAETDALLGRDDLDQIAATVILDLAAEWPRMQASGDYPADPTGEGSRVAWSLLMKAVRWRLIEEGVLVDQSKARDSLDGALDAFEETGSLGEELRGAISTPHVGPAALLQRALADFIDEMPIEEQTLLALRFFEDLPVFELGELIGHKGREDSKTRLKTARGRLRAFATCQVSETVVRPVKPRYREWMPSADLLAFIVDRYGPSATFPGWLELARAAYLTDIAYLCAILDDTRVISATAFAAKRRFTDEDAAEMTRRFMAGERQADIARDYGCAQTQVSREIRRRAS